MGVFRRFAPVPWRVGCLCYNGRMLMRMLQWMFRRYAGTGCTGTYCVGTYCVLAAGILCVPQAMLMAQATPAVTHWKSSVDASGTMLYGAASQRVFSLAAGVARADKQFELRIDALSVYGDAKNQTSGHRTIIVRNSRVSSSFDWHPHERLNPFMLVSAESNYQQRYASRVAAGAGAKLAIWRPETVGGGFVQDASVSLALLAEGTRALRDTSRHVTAGTTPKISARQCNVAWCRFGNCATHMTATKKRLQQQAVSNDM